MTPDSWVAELDARQRAMLAEMGVRVWAPKAGPVAAPVDTVLPAVAEPVQTVAAPVPAAPAARTPAVQAPVAGAPVDVPVKVPVRAPVHLPDLGQMDWATLRETVAGCQACSLCRNRTNTVFGVGDLSADWMVVGEAPGEDEDRQGEPFVGPAGQLLDRMLQAVGRSRQGQGGQGVYIANALKCRPPANRNPRPDEIAQCAPYVLRQVELLRPRLILAMGRFAVQALLGSTEPIGRLRGRVHQHQGIPVIVTYHPSYLLRTPIDKRKAWADLCLAMDTADQPA
ncbi:MAG: uracil-DNA glycosylase [Burkholderiaceae bacterium]